MANQNLSMTAIQSICTQRRQIALFNIPPIRKELVCPPPGFTTEQLNMRRKAEILKYNATKTNSKTNNLTKAQRFALLANNNRSQGLSQYFISNADPAVPICPNDVSIPTSTSSSDVPGPIINLVYDPTVPLYNYSTGQDSLGIINPETTSAWNVFSTNDIYFADGVETTLMYVSFTNLLNTGFYHFTISTPVAISVQGTFLNTSSNIVDVSINSVHFGVYYSDNLVTSIGNPTLDYTFTDVSFNTNTGTVGDFSGNQYVGMLNIRDIYLSATQGFMYEFRITFNLRYKSPFPSNISGWQMGTYCNVSNKNVNQSNHFVWRSSPSNEPLLSQSFVSTDY
jgi:hypothetical protein